MSIQERARLIRQATPNCREDLFERQNRLCDLCGHSIQDLLLAALDHSTPVLFYARALDVDIYDAVRECNDPTNLRVAHKSCYIAKGDRTREEWFARGLNNRKPPKIRTDGELLELRMRLSAIGREGGRKGGRIGGRATNGTTNGRKGRGCAVGGRVAGRIAANKSGFMAHISSLVSPEAKGRGGRSGLNANPEFRSQLGRKGGVIGIRRLQELYPDMASRNGRKTKADGKGIFARTEKQMTVDAMLGHHIRWHINRDLVKDDCLLCQQSQKVA